MLTLLLGEDIYSKQEYLAQKLANFDGEVTKYQLGDKLPRLSSLGQNSLFGTNSSYVFFNCLSEYELSELESVKNTSVPIYFLEEKLDKRLKLTKDILAIVELKEFFAPDISQSSAWILNHANSLGILIQPQAASELANRLLGETKQTLSTFSAHNELLKLESFAGGKTITKEMVEELVVQDLNIDLFKLLDQIGTKNKNSAVSMLNQYYDSVTEDEKTATIKLSALLSDQLRSLLITKEFLEQGVSDKDILIATGWKSGRLFIMKKLARNFSIVQLTSTLAKFYNLDKEIKTSGLPPRVIVGMIIAGL